MSTSMPFGMPLSDLAGTSNPFAPPTPVAPTDPARWSNIPWLDALRKHADPAGEAVARALAPGSAMSTRAVFAAFRAGATRFPAGTPEVLVQFARDAFGYSDTDGFTQLPAWADRDRIRRGQTAFMTRALPAVLVMLCKSLPEGYAAPSMARILGLSGDLTQNSRHRLMGTLQLLLNVSAPGSFDVGGPGIISGLEMRLMHAGVRANVAPAVLGAEKLAQFRAMYGEPVNQEDMVGTILGFSLLVIEGLTILGLPWSEQDAEDYYHVWSVFAHLMGVRGPGLSDGDNGMPATLAQARMFYEAYQRHYVGATDFDGDFRARSLAANPDGVALADAHVQMLTTYVPRLTRAVTGDEIPRAYIHMLVGEKAAARIAVRPDRPLHLLEPLLRDLPDVLERVMGHTSQDLHVHIAEMLFGEMVNTTFPQGVVFPTPSSKQDLNDLVSQTVHTT